jgi:hypothetical protein
MAARKFLFMASDGFNEEGADADSTTLGGLTMGGNIDMNSAGKVVGSNDASTDGDLIAYGQASANLAGLTIDTAALVMSTQQITGLADGSSADHAINKGQLDNAVIQGGSMREFLLHEDQLDDAEGVLASIALVMVDQPVSGDLVTTDDGTTAREYGATAGGDVQYTIGASAAATMQNLVDAINGDGSATCTAALSTDLDAIAATVVVITEADNDGGAHKLYGVWTTQANVDAVDYTDELNYENKTLTDMPATEPAATNFGFRRTQASLTAGELHYVENNDVLYGWDDDSDTWNQMSGGGSIPDATAASGGGVKGKVTFDSDLGMAVAAGVASLNITADKGLHFNSGALEIELASADRLSAGASGLDVVGVPSLFEINGTAVGSTVTAANLDTLTDTSDAAGIHTHGNSDLTVAHASTTGKTVNDHHNQSHVLDGGDHTVSGLTTGFVLTATGATTFAFQAAGAGSEAPRIENSLVAVENVSAADPVYHSSTADKFGKADAGTDAKAYVFGVAKAGILADASGEIVSYGLCAGILSGATAGAKYYLQDGGGIGTSIAGAGKRIIMIGWAQNADDLWVQPIDYGKKAA